MVSHHLLSHRSVHAQLTLYPPSGPCRFHKPIEGELGHEPEKEGGDKSSLEQIVSPASTPLPAFALQRL